jgi:hypothetical protein
MAKLLSLLLCFVFLAAVVVSAVEVIYVPSLCVSISLVQNVQSIIYIHAPKCLKFVLKSSTVPFYNI